MMKILAAILLTSANAKATTYYLSNAGSNSANGTSTSTTWQTNVKVNSFSFSSGDSILYKCGETFSGQLLPPRSNLYFGNYSTGSKPVISGFQNVTGWSNFTGNIWSAAKPSGATNLNTVVVNGVLMGKARYPNSGFLLLHPETSTTTSLSTDLTGTPNYAGAQAVVRVQYYITEVSAISSQVTSTLNLATTLTYSPVYIGNSGKFFLQNLPYFADVAGEWADSSGNIYLNSSGSPTDVKASIIDTLVSIVNKSYITFENLTFTGSNLKAANFDTCRHITFKGCLFDNNGRDAISAKESDVAVLDADTITNSLNDGIMISRHSDSTSITNCVVRKSGLIEGLAASGNSAGENIYSDGFKQILSNNTTDSSGYNSLFWDGDSVLVYHHYATNFCLNKDDGGGIVTAGLSVSGISNTGSIVRSCIAVNGIGVNSTAACFYLDGTSSYVTVDSCTGSNGFVQCTLFNFPDHITYTNNLMDDSLGVPFWYALGGAGHTNNITNNIFYSRNSSKVAFFYAYTSQVGTVIDYNHVMRPLAENTKYGSTNSITFYSLAQWQAATVWSDHDSTTPANITSAPGRLYINPTDHDSTIIFNGIKKDAFGTLYLGSAILHSFQSKLLFTSYSNYINRIAGRLFN